MWAHAAQSPSHPSWMRLLNVHHNSHVWHSTLSGWSMDLRMSFTSLKTEGQHVDVRCTSEESCALTMSFLSLKRDGHSLVWHFMKQGVNTVPSQSEERRELFDTFWDKELTSNSVPSQSEKRWELSDILWSKELTIMVSLCSLKKDRSCLNFLR